LALALVVNHLENSNVWDSFLNYPDPPSLICIEEPELGMHPDSLSILAALLKEASERTRLIVTIHSDVLVDAFSDEPENVVVCEKKTARPQ
jgi:predicted ATPase